MKNLTMKEVRAKGYQVFPDVEDEDRAARLEATLKYFEHLGVVTKTNINTWPVLEILRAPKGGLVADRGQINQRFFTWKDEHPEDPETPVEALSREIVLELGQRLNELGNDSTTKIKQNLEYNLSQLKTYSKEAARYQEAAIKLQWRLMEKERTGPAAIEHKLVEWIERLIQEKKYVLPEKQEKEGFCLITTPIIKTFFNKKQATNTTVPLGQYKVHWVPGGKMRVSGFKDNVIAQKRVHPHVHDYGICMGPMGVHYDEAAATLNFYKMFDVIYDILANFEERDGYTPLYMFEDSYKAMIKDLPNPHPDPIFEDEEDEDEDEDPGDYEDDPENGVDF